MPKVNYTKVEEVFNEALYRLFLKNLYELAAIATQAQEGTTPLDTEMVDKILKDFRAELKKLKKADMKLYSEMGISEQEEARLLSPSKDFTRADWLKLIDLKEKMEKINAERGNGGEITPEDEERVLRERKDHIHKRFNVRKGWLPLH